MNGARHQVEQYVDSGVSVITLCEGKNGNLLTLGSLREIDAAIKSALADPAARVILLRSDGGAFCLGMDLSLLGNLEGREEEGASEAKEAVSLYSAVLSLIHSAPKPVVSLLEGEVKAGGVGLACACDVVLASERASFELGEIFFGLIPANVLPYIFSLRLAPQKARYLVMTGKRIDAREGRRLGLIDEVFTEAELEKSCRAVMRNLLRCSPAALAEAKAFTDFLLETDLVGARRIAQAKILEMIAKPGAREAAAAFRDGGVPAWFAQYRPRFPLSAKGKEG
jgi:enoyl-CoA hydratase/carnithine racemase